MKRKGQAAMEFLMTYGWAILAAIIVIGILAFYFRPTDLGSGNSYVNEPLHLVSQSVRGTSLQLQIRNDEATGITVFKAVVNGTSPDTDCTYSDSTGTAFAVGESKVIAATCGAILTTGTTYQGSIDVIYLKTGAALNSTVSGQFSEEVA